MKFLFLFCLTFFAPCIHAMEVVITPELLTLLDHFHLEHDGTLTSINEATQKAWLRPAGKERWETEDTFSAGDREAVLEYYIKTGKLQEKRPAKSEYRYGVICGATTFRMKDRLGYFEQLGLRVDEVVLLSGARSLDPAVEEILPGCQTEGDALIKLWEASPLYPTASWKHLQHPMITKDKRPGAYDIFQLWLKEKPAGAAVVVVNQPYCCYYEAVANWVFLDVIEVEVVGAAANPDYQKTDTLLDNLARWIYIHTRY